MARRALALDQLPQDVGEQDRVARGGIADRKRAGGPRVPYALAGALAYGQYGIPQATNDVDLNVFVEPSGLGPVFEALRALGVEVDEDAVARISGDTRRRSRPAQRACHRVMVAGSS
ncbi:hypothetical protein K2Z84_30930 [Candidatus Binatia bacterium]|nr:hypothetical protein [Candidatus Binatia bacterium]